MNIHNQELLIKQNTTTGIITMQEVTRGNDGTSEFILIRSKNMEAEK